MPATKRSAPHGPERVDKTAPTLSDTARDPTHDPYRVRSADELLCIALRGGAAHALADCTICEALANARKRGDLPRDRV